MFKNATIFRLTSTAPGLQHFDLEARAVAQAFAPCGPTQPESRGWVPPRGEDGGALIESVGGELILRLMRETRAVPSAAIKDALDKRLDKVEAETGRRPKGKPVKELKEEIVQDLLPRAFPKRSAIPVWISWTAGLVVVGASLRAADAVVTMLVELLGGEAVLRALNTRDSPTVAMSLWLSSQEAPAGFSLDRECELKQPDSEKSTVRYARHTLDIDEVREHIRQGKQPTHLAMTWNSRVSFVLTEALTLKKIQLLDVVMEQAGEGLLDSGFDADAALATGELLGLIGSLVAALGGEDRQQQPH